MEEIPVLYLDDNALLELLQNLTAMHKDIIPSLVKNIYMYSDNRIDIEDYEDLVKAFIHFTTESLDGLIRLSTLLKNQ
tara:strand:- start:1054 stop:1287 length:234 start_codon:yes stop_codon:yes gene_type:complete